MAEELKFLIITGKISAALIAGMGALEIIVCILEKAIHGRNTYYIWDGITVAIKGTALWTFIIILEQLLQKFAML